MQVKKYSLKEEDFPKSWNQLSGPQVATIAYEYYVRIKPFVKIENGKVVIEDEERLLESFIFIAYVLSGKAESVFNNLSESQMHEILFVWKVVDPFIKEANNLTVNPFTELEVKSKMGMKRKFVGPVASWVPLATGKEFAFADRYYTKFMESGQEDLLNGLVAVLFREVKVNYSLHTDADKRAPFDNKTADWRVEEMKKISLPMKLGILHWFEGCRNEMVKTHKSLFSSGNEAEADIHGWAGTFQNIAGPELGTVEQVENMYLTKILQACSIMKANVKALKRK